MARAARMGQVRVTMGGVVAMSEGILDHAGRFHRQLGKVRGLPTLLATPQHSTAHYTTPHHIQSHHITQHITPPAICSHVCGYKAIHIAIYTASEHLGDSTIFEIPRDHVEGFLEPF